jgi:hypothetical protein
MPHSTATKILSLRSSDDVSPVPNVTPATEAANEHPVHDDTDLEAVTETLAPIQEELNEAAENATFPSPPVQTPLAFSPTPSIVYRQLQRGRGMSVINERLNQLSLAGRINEASSVRSGEGDNLGSPTGSIPITMGSPAANPRIAEYLAYREGDKDVSGHAGKEVNLANLLEDQGVSEQSIWAEEVETDLDHVIKRLIQLASDEAGLTGTEASIRKIAMERLQKVLDAHDLGLALVEKLEE